MVLLVAVYLLEIKALVYNNMFTATFFFFKGKNTVNKVNARPLGKD